MMLYLFIVLAWIVLSVPVALAVGYALDVLGR